MYFQNEASYPFLMYCRISCRTPLLLSRLIPLNERTASVITKHIIFEDHAIASLQVS